MLPWYEHARRGPDKPPECGSCLTSQSRITRQALGCGYEPPAPAFVPVIPWDHTGRQQLSGESQLKICPGYVCRLPEVTEVARAHLHWDRGSLSVLTKDPSDVLIDGIEVMEGSIQSFKSWTMKPKDQQ
jgi:hypothetical protein